MRSAQYSCTVTVSVFKVTVFGTEPWFRWSEIEFRGFVFRNKADPEIGSDSIDEAVTAALVEVANILLAWATHAKSLASGEAQG